MGDLELVEEMPLTMAEVQDELDKIEKRDEELSIRGKKAKEYLAKFKEIDSKAAKELKEKINALGLQRLKDKHITKIIDLTPKDLDSLKTILSGENITLKQEELQKVLECIR